MKKVASTGSRQRNTWLRNEHANKSVAARMMEQRKNKRTRSEIVLKNETAHRVTPTIPNLWAIHETKASRNPLTKAGGHKTPNTPKAMSRQTARATIVRVILPPLPRWSEGVV